MFLVYIWRGKQERKEEKLRRKERKEIHVSFQGSSFSHIFIHSFFNFPFSETIREQRGILFWPGISWCASRKLQFRVCELSWRWKSHISPNPGRLSFWWLVFIEVCVCIAPSLLIYTKKTRGDRAGLAFAAFAICKPEYCRSSLRRDVCCV